LLLKKKVEEPEEEEEDMYEYVEEEEEEEIVSKKKSNKYANEKITKKLTTPATSTTISANKSKNLTRDKTSSSHNDEDANPDTDQATKQDIRTAFFRASAAAKPKAEKKLADTGGASAEAEDDLANEIMQELTNKKPAAKPVTRPKPQMTSGFTPGRSHIPFAAANSPHMNTSNPVLSLSPAHKRKLSPSKPQAGDNQPQFPKKIELDEELMHQLFDGDSNQATSNSSGAQISIKSEPVSIEEKSVGAVDASTAAKSEKLDYDESNEDLDDLELLSSLSLEGGNCSMLAKYLNLPTKQQENAGADQLDLSMNNQSSTTHEEVDFSAQIKDMDNSSKILVYWLDAFEDQFNSNGTVYLFGKMPIATNPKATSSEADTPESTTPATNQQLSFVSVCCIVKNIPKVLYVLPRKYRKSKVKREPGVVEAAPREAATMDDVKKEIDALMERCKIFTYRTRVVKKNFAFDVQRKVQAVDPDDEASYESEYLHVEFQPDKHSILNLLDTAEGECFSTIFNTNSSHLEHLLIDLKLKGNFKIN
jgi:hypothetical protein